MWSPPEVFWVCPIGRRPVEDQVMVQMLDLGWPCNAAVFPGMSWQGEECLGFLLRPSVGERNQKDG